MGKRLIALLAGIASIIVACGFFFVVKGLLSFPMYLDFSLVEFVVNALATGFFGAAGIMLVVWACTPQRT